MTKWQRDDERSAKPVRRSRFRLLAAKPAIAIMVMVLAATAVVALLSLQLPSEQDSAYAVGPVPLVMGIDTVTTGNACGPSTPPADGCTLGTIEDCVRVDYTAGGFDGVADYMIDVYIDDPAGSAPAPTAYDAWVYYDETKVHIADGTPPAPYTDGKIKITGGDFGGTDENTLPDSDGKFVGGWMFMLGTPNPGVNTYIGDGPVLRLGLDIDGTKSGLVTFSFDEMGSGYLSAAGDHDLTFQSGQLAINTPCPVFADAYIVSQEVLSSDCVNPIATMPVDTNTDVCLHKVLRQNDIATLDVDVTPSATPPGGCTAAFKSGPGSATLPQNTNVDVNEIFTLNCTAPSTHQFTFDNEIATTGGAIDTNPANNSDSTDKSLDVTAVADLQTTGVSVDAPGQWAIDGAFDVTVNANVTNAGPYGPVTADVTLDLDLSGAANCSRVPDTSQSDDGLSLGTDVATATWSVTCSTTGTKTFDGTASVALASDQPHISNPDSNDSDTGSDSTYITASADVHVVNWSIAEDDLPIAGNQILIAPGTPETITTNQVMHNIGPQDAPVVDDVRTVTDTAECNVTPNSYSGPFNLSVSVNAPQDDTWSVAWTGGGIYCTLTFDKALSIPANGVSDPEPGNNDASASVDVVLDTDGDTVPDNYDILNDNCDTVSNPGQLDTDADTIGDACDDDCDGDVDAVDALFVLQHVVGLRPVLCPTS